MSFRPAGNNPWSAGDDPIHCWIYTSPWLTCQVIKLIKRSMSSSVSGNNTPCPLTKDVHYMNSNQNSISKRVYCFINYKYTINTHLRTRSHTDRDNPSWFQCCSFLRLKPWWRHQMDIFSALLSLCVGNSPITGQFPSQRPVTRSFDVFFDLRLNKRLSKQPRYRWSERPSRSLWSHCNASHIGTRANVLTNEQLSFLSA